jgi:CBS-domain-containing membrane protein
MAQNNLDSLPVVDPSDAQRVVGLLSRVDLFKARVLWFAEEKQRERVLSMPTFSIKKAIGSGRKRIRKFNFFSRKLTSYGTRTNTYS